MQQIALENRLTEDSTLLASNALLHALVGAWMAEHVYGVTDPEILEAIRVHTTGKPGMTPLDMTVYLADKVEPGRQAFPMLAKLRMLAPLSLTRAMAASLEGTRDYVKDGGKSLHPQSLETLAWIRDHQT